MFLDDKDDSKSTAVVNELENIDDECDSKVIDWFLFPLFFIMSIAIGFNWKIRASLL